MVYYKKYLPDFIFGGIDGLVTTFAVVSGVIGAGLETKIILILGFANLLADGFSMAASNYLSSRSVEDLNQGSNGKTPLRAGLATFVAFVVIGIIPLLSFVVDFGTINFVIAIILTGLAFFAVGYIKGNIVGKNHWGSALETLVVGAAAAIISYVIGYLLSGLGA